MRKIHWSIILISVIGIIAVFTNPGVERHKDEVKTKLTSYMHKKISDDAEPKSKWESAGQNLGLLLGNSIIERVVESAITVDNYILFSLTKMSWKGENKIIGYGVFGNVFLSDKVDQAMEEADSNRNKTEI